jgi:ABC-type dipeptide/oligopeptide/nickel transport system ATPase component
VFVFTKSFREIYRIFLSLKVSKGRFILIIGAPGSGKSANIYSALKILDLNIYDPTFFLDDVKVGSKKVYQEFFRSLKDDLGVKTNKEVYRKVKEYDAVLLADKILDSEFLDQRKVGIGLWSEYKCILAFPFYILVFFQYLKHRKDLEDINLITQTSLMVIIKEVKYDLLTDFSILSQILVFILKFFFDVVRISYSEEETIKIIKNKFRSVNEEKIRLYIKKYGNKPRFIFEALEKNDLERLINQKKQIV